MYPAIRNILDKFYEYLDARMLELIADAHGVGRDSLTVNTFDKRKEFEAAIGIREG